MRFFSGDDFNGPSVYMEIVAFAGVLAVALAAADRYFSDGHGLKLAFFVIFLLLAPRYEFGNDYVAYLEAFEDINRQQSVDYFSSELGFESGWVLLCRVFGGLGFFYMVAVLAAFHCFVFWRFVHRYVPMNYYWLAVFLFFFVPDNMLVQSSAMRQALALSIFVFAVEFLAKRNFVGYVACVLLAGSFHSSAFLLLPFVVLGVRMGLGNALIWLLAALYGVLFFVSEQLLAYLQGAIFFSDGGLLSDRYGVYEEKGSVGSGVGVVYLFFNLLFLLFMHDRQSLRDFVFFRLSMVGIYFLPFAVALSMLSRVGYYFNLMAIVALPIVASQIKIRWVRVVFVGVNLIFVLWSFFGFFQSEIYSRAFGEYKTVFSVSM